MTIKTNSLRESLVRGDRRSLAKAITLIESRRPDHRDLANELLQAIMPFVGQSVRLGVSGAPGVGKSTFIEAFGQDILAKGHKLAILAIDPTSPLTGGSILGDRTRMETLSSDSRVFIRPSPAGTTLGGVARHTHEAILACEAAGYDYVIVETVGVGQSETLVQSMVDIFLILHLPNAGDELQGIKRGILELADVVAVTKADGDQIRAAERTKGQLEQALMLARGTEGELPSVLTLSSTERTGLSVVHETIESLVTKRKKTKAWHQRREQQAARWFQSELGELLREIVSERPAYAKLMADQEKLVLSGQLPASIAARQVLEKILGD